MIKIIPTEILILIAWTLNTLTFTSMVILNPSVSSVQSLSRVQLFAAPWTAAQKHKRYRDHLSLSMNDATEDKRGNDACSK